MFRLIKRYHISIDLILDKIQQAGEITEERVPENMTKRATVNVQHMIA